MENGRRYHAYRDGQYHLPNDDVTSHCPAEHISTTADTSVA